MNLASQSNPLLKRSLKCLAVGLVLAAATAGSAEAYDGRGHRNPPHARHHAAPVHQGWHGHSHWRPAHYYRPHVYAPPVYAQPVYYGSPGFTVVLPFNIR